MVFDRLNNVKAMETERADHALVAGPKYGTTTKAWHSSGKVARLKA